MKNRKVIKTATEYKIALQRTIDLFEIEDNSEESDELELLLALMNDYEEKHVHLPLVIEVNK